MKTILSFIAPAVMLTLFSIVEIKAQSNDDSVKAEKEKKFYEAKHKLDQGGGGFGYSGGMLAPIGASLYFLYPEKVGFYASCRFGSGPEEVDENVTKVDPYKGLVLNIGITKNFSYPFGAYIAAGISDYNTYIPQKNYKALQKNWELGADVSGGIIITVLREFNFMGGVSLYNFSKPEACFGLGWNFGR